MIEGVILKNGIINGAISRLTDMYEVLYRIVSIKRKFARNEIGNIVIKYTNGDVQIFNISAPEENEEDLERIITDVLEITQNAIKQEEETVSERLKEQKAQIERLL